MVGIIDKLFFRTSSCK